MDASSATTENTASRDGSSGSPNRSAQSSRSAPVAGNTSQRRGNQLRSSSQIRTRSRGKNGRQSPSPSSRKGNSGAARSNGTSTRTAERPSTSPLPSTVTPPASASVVSGRTRSVGIRAEVENGRRLRTSDSRSGHVEVGHGAGPAAYQSDPSTTSRRSVGVVSTGYEVSSTMSSRNRSGASNHTRIVSSRSVTSVERLRSTIANVAWYASRSTAAEATPSVTSAAARAASRGRSCHGPPTTRLPAIAPTSRPAIAGARRGSRARRLRAGRTTRRRACRRSARTADMTSPTRSGTAGATSNRAASRSRYAPRSNAAQVAQDARCRSSAASARGDWRSPSIRADRRRSACSWFIGRPPPRPRARPSSLGAPDASGS